MHSYTPSSSGNTAPLMVRTEVVIPFVTPLITPACRSKSTTGSVDVSACLLLGISSPFILQVKVGVGSPSEVQVRVRLPPSMTVLVGDWVMVIGATEDRKGGQHQLLRIKVDSITPHVPRATEAHSHWSTGGPGNVKTVLYMVNERTHEARRLGGSGGMPPRKFLNFRPSKIASDTILRYKAP